MTLKQRLEKFLKGNSRRDASFTLFFQHRLKRQYLDVRIYNQALSAAEIAVIYNATR